MARPIKKGLDYFPVDTTILSDRKVRRMKNRYGAESFLLYMALLCDVYAASYWIQVNDDYLFDLSDQLEIPESRVKEILLEMAKIGLFDAALYAEKRILTSKGIQKRYAFAKSKSIDDQRSMDYSLLVSEEETPVLASETPIKQPISTQSKEKESKENIERVSSREQWQIWKSELLSDPDWRASTVRQSGKGTSFDLQIENTFDTFCDYLVSSSEQDTITNKKDFTRRYHYWWQYHGAKHFAGYTWQQNQGCSKRRSTSRIEEINRIGDESLEIARKIMRGESPF